MLPLLRSVVSCRRVCLGTCRISGWNFMSLLDYLNKGEMVYSEHLSDRNKWKWLCKETGTYCLKLCSTLLKTTMCTYSVPIRNLNEVNITKYVTILACIRSMKYFKSLLWYVGKQWLSIHTVYRRSLYVRVILKCK